MIRKRSAKKIAYDNWLEVEVRPYVIKRDGDRCMCCKRPAHIGEKLDLDHIQGKGAHPDMKYTLGNFQLLDRVCHYFKTNYAWKDCPHEHN